MKKFLIIFLTVFPLFAFGAAHDLMLTLVNLGSTNITSLGIYRSGSQPPGSMWSSGDDDSFAGVFNATSGNNILPGHTFTILIPNEGFYTTDGSLSDDLTFSVVVSNGTYSTNSLWTIVDGGYASYTSPAQQTVTIFVYIGGANTGPTYTNYTYCVNNTSTTLFEQATWTFNGSVVQSELIAPGSTACWTSPSIEVSPVAQPASLNVTTSFPAAQFVNTESNGVLNFAPPTDSANSSPLGNSGPGTAAPTGTPSSNNGSTNTIAPPPPVAVTAPTNIVTFAPPSTTGSQVGLASESTLNNGFQLLHQDLLNVQNGQSIINNSVNSGLIEVTNQLGQVVTLLTSNAYIDGQWIPQIYGAITNQTADLSNALDNLSLGSSSNLNQQITQVGISNLLANTLILSNDDFDTNLLTTNVSYVINAEDTNALAAIASAQAALGSVFLGLIPSATNAIGSYLSQNIPAGAEPDFTISIPLAGVSFDANPVTQFPWFFLFLHALVTWLCVVYFVTGAVTTLDKILQAYASAVTGNVPNLSGGAGIKGTPVNQA